MKHLLLHLNMWLYCCLGLRWDELEESRTLLYLYSTQSLGKNGYLRARSVYFHQLSPKILSLWEHRAQFKRSNKIHTHKSQYTGHLTWKKYGSMSSCSFLKYEARSVGPSYTTISILLITFFFLGFKLRALARCDLMEFVCVGLRI